MTPVSDPTHDTGQHAASPLAEEAGASPDHAEVDAPLATITMLIYELDRQAVEIRLGVNAPPEQAPAIRDRAIEVAQQALEDARASFAD